MAIINSSSTLTADFAYAQPGIVAGGVYNDLNSNGVQDAGEPGISGVTVTLSNGNITTTDASGLYTFTVMPGAYTVVETNLPTYVNTGAEAGTVGSTILTHDSIQVVITSGAVSTGNDFLDTRLSTISGKVFNDANGSGVQDGTELGIGGVTVVLVDGSGTIVASTTTGSDGSYTFPNVPAGSYTVRESDPFGYISTTNNVVPVSVADGVSVTANFGDQQTGTVSGTVFNDVNGDGNQDNGEIGINAVTVQLVDGVSGSVVATTTTNINGGYLFSNVSSGSYIVRETDPNGFVSTTSNTVPVSVPPGGSATANFGDQQTGTVSGVVFNDINGDGTQDTGENGLSGVTVRLVNSSGVVVGVATTGANGSYLFTNVTAGAYTVREADPSGYVSTTNNIVPVSVPPAGSATANFGDQQVGTISGLVFNDINGDGIQGPGELGLGGVLISLVDGNGTVVATTTTAPDGSYTFAGVTPGAYSVGETDPSGYLSTTPNTVAITLASGAAATANFGDQVPGRIGDFVWYDTNGNGLQDAGEPGIPDVVISLVGPLGPMGTVTTDANGAYLFSGLLSGNYTVTVVSGQPAGATLTGGATPLVINLSMGQNYLTADFGYDVPTSYQMNKSLVTPGPVRVGENVTYRIAITNTGSSWLTLLPVQDLYENRLLHFVSATIAPDSPLDDGQLDWADLTTSVGDVAPNQVVAINLTFAALRDSTDLVGGVVINTAVVGPVQADPDGPTGPLGSVESVPTSTTSQVSLVVQGPTAVLVTEMSARRQDAAVLLRWRTEGEMNTVGFNLLRRQGEGAWVQLNESLVPAQRGGQDEGIVYLFTDSHPMVAGEVEYALQILSVDGGISQMTLGRLMPEGLYHLYLPLMLVG